MSSDADLLEEFRALWAEADALWEGDRDEPAFGGYVSADYPSIYESLRNIRGEVSTLLEWGSGLGVVTIMASRLGFEAYGIESEAVLVAHAEEFNANYGADARFATGSFIPDAFEWDPASGDDVIRTDVDEAAAYDEFDMELRDFDLVYAYPWPDEQLMFRNIMRQFGGSHARMLIYDAREGLEMIRYEDL